MRRPKGLLVILGVSLLFAVGAAACGGGGDDAEPEPAKPAVPAAAVPAPASALAAASAPTAAPAPEPTNTPVAKATPTPSPAASARSGDEELAPELRDIASWINSEPFTLESQRGKVVLVDFWTYTCVNCIRTLPYLKDWHSKYADRGLVILGVHSPEFEFEELRENVLDAVDEFGIEYAVAQDNDHGTWRAFRNRYWPAKYLIDKDGYIRYTHFGEGAYDETEGWIRDLLAETGADLGDIRIGSEPPPARDPAGRSIDPGQSLTRELYAGYDRNYNALVSQTDPPYVLHAEYYEEPDADVLYTDPGDHKNHFIFLQGLWRNTAESLVHARETEDHEDYMAIKFYANSVNTVMVSADSMPYEVRLTLDDRPLEAEEAGADVMFDGDGNSYVLVDESRMYRLVELPEFNGHELKLSSNSQMEVFAFTFGSYMSGP